MLKLTKSDQKKGTLPNRKVIPRRRSKKGFTLIELLSVIVVLAIILLIATPIILNVIKDARIGAFGSSKKNIERAAELYYASNSGKVKFENEISYVEIGTLIEEGYLKEGITNALTKSKLDTSTKVLIYKSGRNIEFSLQMYDEVFLDWYKEEMVKATKKLKKEPIEGTIEVSLEELMNSKEVSELRLPIDLENRCVGYVEITKVNNKNEYQAYVDCLTESSSFASHYVSYGGKYLDEFNDVKETSDGGFIAVGRSNSEVITKYGTGNNGKYDAIIVKFNSKGEVEWSKNFGGSNNDHFNAVIEVPNGYVAVGQTASNDGDIEDYKGGTNDALIVSYDFNGNVIYKRSYGGSGDNGEESFQNILLENDKIYIIGVINLYNLDGDHSGLSVTGSRRRRIILEYSTDMEMLSKEIYNGTGYINNLSILKDSDYFVGVGSDKGSSNVGYVYKLDGNFNVVLDNYFEGRFTTFYDLVTTLDGYIVVGYSNSSEIDMEGLSKANNGGNDAVIVKYDKDLNVVWKKSFGGSNDDAFYGIEKLTETEVVVVGYSKSNDMDMEGISKSNEGYSNAVIVKFNAITGDIIKKEIFGGSNSEIFRKIIKTKDNKLLVTGSSYSESLDLKNFNKGHQDAIVVKYNNDLKLVKELEEAVVIIDKIKEINPNYGTSLSLKYDKIYTTNDPEKDLKGWCSASETRGNNSYDYVQCLKPMNIDDFKLLTNIEESYGSKKIYQGRQEYLIDNKPDKFNNWYQIKFIGQNSGEVVISNIELKFIDGYVGSIRESVNNGYLEPLVVVANQLTSLPDELYENPINILEKNGMFGPSKRAIFYINLKPKKELKSLIFTANKNFDGAAAGFNISELRNFDMSITPTN